MSPRTRARTHPRPTCRCSPEWCAPISSRSSSPPHPLLPLPLFLPFRRQSPRRPWLRPREAAAEAPADAPSDAEESSDAEEEPAVHVTSASAVSSESLIDSVPPGLFGSAPVSQPAPDAEPQPAAPAADTSADTLIPEATDVQDAAAPPVDEYDLLWARRSHARSRPPPSSSRTPRTRTSTTSSKPPPPSPRRRSASPRHAMITATSATTTVRRSPSPRCGRCAPSDPRSIRPTTFPPAGRLAGAFGCRPVGSSSSNAR